LSETGSLLPHGLQVEEYGSYDRKQGGDPVLRQQGEPTGEEYVAEVLRMAGDGVQAPVHDAVRLHIGLAIFCSAVLGEQVERPKDEITGQQ